MSKSKGTKEQNEKQPCPVCAVVANGGVKPGMGGRHLRPLEGVWPWFYRAVVVRLEAEDGRTCDCGIALEAS